MSNLQNVITRVTNKHLRASSTRHIELLGDKMRPNPGPHRVVQWGGNEGTERKLDHSLDANAFVAFIGRTQI
jgi:hypothetical protein